MTPSLPPPFPAFPWRIAIAGLGRQGRHHLEGLSLRSDCRVVAVQEADPVLACQARPLCDRVLSDWQELLASEDVDIVLWSESPSLTVPRIQRTLAAGKHAVSDGYPRATGAETARLLSQADEARVTWSILTPRRQERDFRTLLETAASGRLGEVMSARCVCLNGAVIEPDPQPSDLGHGPETSAEVLRRHAAPLVDQLCCLIPAEPVQVFASCLAPPNAWRGGNAFVLMVQFKDGRTGVMEAGVGIHPEQSGWRLLGSLGSAEHGRMFLMQPDGEVAEMQCDSLPAETTGYDELFRTLGRGRLEPRESRVVSAVAGILHAAAISLETKSPERVV